ncbi:prepilin-type N-terminal cleavage/methylation domain-containing protein [Candidatus Saganbacteria bacterium]|nr:prepilin-type N-terminal cleavage/methylation domain-containing protein [Candidatus Saganbacteria bacterium]
MKNRRGFTLIEAASVIVILMILAVGSFVYIGFTNGIKLDAAANKLAADIRYAQSRAMSYTVWHGVIFNVNPTNTYSVYSTDGSTDTVVEDPAKLASNLTVNLNTAYGATINSVSIQEGGNKIEFSPLGAPWTDKNGMLLSSEAGVVIGLAGQTKTITITQNTGKVNVE